MVRERAVRLSKPATRVDFFDIAEFETILKVGEHIGVEFKSAKGGPKDDTYETVCSFLNRFGGDIFLGVTDAGEVVGNTLVHREFSSSRPSRLIVYKDRLVCDNASKAMRSGPITPDNLSPVSKNPIIARFFKQMGRADELDTGTRNLFHYPKLYSNALPVLDEGDTFSVTVSLDDSYSVDQEGLGEDVLGGMKTGMENADYIESTENQSAMTALRDALKIALRSRSKNDADPIVDKIISIRDVLKRPLKSSLSAIAADLEMSERIVDEYVSLLKEVGAIHRKDGKRFGEWEVLK